MIQQQLLSLLSHPPQPNSRIRIQIHELLENPMRLPQSLSHPHPQFVAAKSLMFDILRRVFTLYHMRSSRNGDKTYLLFLWVKQQSFHEAH